MKIVIFLILGFGIFDVALSRGLGQIFSDWYDDVFEDSGESSEVSFCDIFSELFGLDFDDDDDNSQPSTGPVHHQLPGGPSWIEAMYPSGPQRPGQEDNRPGEVGEGGQRPPSTNPFHPQQQQQPQEQVPPQLFANAKPIPTRPPGQEQTGENSASYNTTQPPASPLIISIPQDEVDDTDGEGVLERVQETG